MKFLEKDLEQIIWESDNLKLQEKGLRILGKKIRQLKIGNYGIADIVSVRKYYEDNSINPILLITILELKKDSISISAFLQAIRYAKGIQRYLDERDFRHAYEIEICLCGKKIDPFSDLVYLPDLIYSNKFSLGGVFLYTYDYTLDGIEFKEHFGYRLVNEGF